MGTLLALTALAAFIALVCFTQYRFNKQIAAAVRELQSEESYASIKGCYLEGRAGDWLDREHLVRKDYEKF